MATQRKTIPKKTTTATTKPRASRKTSTSSSRRTTRKGTGNFVNFFVPMFFILCILFCIGFLTFMGYRTVTASSFFDVKQIEIKGTNKVPREDIEKIVRIESEKNGVWNADLQKIREEIEKTNFVKSATVSRILPDGIRVNIVERKPVAVARIDGGDFWVDDDGAILVLVGRDEARPPFFIQGWNREKSEKTQTENKERVKIYLDMLNQWQEYELAKRVESVNLTNIKEPVAITQDSGERVAIELEVGNYANRLKDGIKAIAGRGSRYEAVNIEGMKMVLVPRNN
ncbi:MAG: FtsQ-type POTRA domain-containing protein [Pyrinomonadaceae bacterium]